jgi:hypothetical protein
VLDFRYHALSLVAVFLALTIGIVLGVTIGDSLLSDAERSLRSNLRADVVSARQNANKAQSELAGRDQMLDQLYPSLVRDRLRGERVALVSWGPLPDGVEKGVRDAVHQGGGRLDSVAVFDKPLTELETALGGSGDDVQNASEASLDEMGRSLADGLIGDGRVGRQLQESFPDSFSGHFRHADAVAFFEPPLPQGNADADGVKERGDDRAKRIQAAMLDELQKRTIATVGVETTGTDPSQIPHYESLKLSTVDSVDKSGGRIALVFVLAGAQGNFGFKSTAKQPLPDEVLSP